MKLNWQDLRTSFDTSMDKARKAFDKGLALGQNTKQFHVAINNVWSADMKNGSTIFSYEKLGYHSYTADFFRGIVTSGCPVVVHR